MKTFGVMTKMCNVRSVRLGLNMELHGEEGFLTVMFGAEACRKSGEERRKFVIMEMKYIRSTCGVTSLDRVKKEEEKHRLGVRKNMNDTMYRKHPK